MTNVAFGLRLTESFPAFNSAANDPFLKGILSLTESLNDDNRQALWNRFYDVYDRTNIPTRPTFAKLIDELGLKVRGRGGKADRYPMMRCQNECGAEFSPSKIRCPRCGNSDKSTLTVFMVRGEPPKEASSQALIPFGEAEMREITSGLAKNKKPGGR